MPFVTRTPSSPPTVSPRPRIQPVPVPVDDTGTAEPAVTSEVSPKAPTRVKLAKREKRQPTGNYPEGYCLTPVRTRFQKGNPGGPGRPRKDSKSQDELMRAELLKSQQVTEGGRRRRRTLRELIPGLLVKATLQKLSPKELRILQDEARRLFPERVADAEALYPIDPLLEREYVRDMLASIQIGEPANSGADPLADFVTSVFEGEDGDENEDDDAPMEHGKHETGDEGAAQ